jgi:hypothetical protein
MNPSVIRLIWILVMVAALVIAVLNLHRVAGLRLPWLPPLLLVLAVAFIVAERRKPG